jgi:hypothetical protein
MIDKIRNFLEEKSVNTLPQEYFNPRLVINAIICHILEKKCFVNDTDYQIVANMESFLIVYKSMFIIAVNKEMYDGIIDDFLEEKPICHVNYGGLTKFIREKIISIESMQKGTVKITSDILSKSVISALEILINNLPINAQQLYTAVSEIDPLITEEKIVACIEVLTAHELLAKFFMNDEDIAKIVLNSFNRMSEGRQIIANETCFAAVHEMLIMKQINEKLREVNMQLVVDVRRLQSQIDEFDIITNAKNEQFTTMPSRISPIVQYRISTPT